MKVSHHIGLLLLRLTSGFLLLLHGIAKIPKGVSGIQNTLIDAGWPGFIAYGVYIGEIIAPILIIIGWRTRIAAILYAINMLFAIFLVHSDDLFKLTKHGGWAIELLGLYLVAAIVLFFTGPGKYALSRNSLGD